MPRLKRVDCSSCGITRRKHGRGFVYVFSDTGERVTDPDMLAHIRDLVIPPAWKDVWICPYVNGHIQATGIDAAGRRQYVYHEQWRTRRDQEKFDRMLEFARALPRLRARCTRDLARPELDRERVLACATRLLDHGFFRIGTESYAEQNQTYGLATMQKRHVRLRDGIVTFDYTAKSGKRRVQSIVDPEVFEVVTALKRRRGGSSELLAYRRGRAWVDVKSADVNAYVKDATGGDFTAKDFRTWNATVLAAVALAVSGEAAKSRTSRKRAMTRAVQEVAHYLGNTPAVCRASYIDPRVFDRYASGWTIHGALGDIGAGAEFGEPSIQGDVEQAVLDLLEDRRDSDAVEKIA
ncbi:MAG TPA: DNA topoisomerase IB [Actinomycetota bacterium]|nr:DNA topoisomerase IB [Actinomycetota bacterium]